MQLPGPYGGSCLEGRSGTFRQMKLPKQSSGAGEQSQVLRESGPRPPDTSQAFGSQRLGAPENPRARMPWCQGASARGHREEAVAVLCGHRSPSPPSSQPSPPMGTFSKKRKGAANSVRSAPFS